MPILKPDIQKALQLAGLNKSDGSGTVAEKLDNAGLSIHEVFTELSGIMSRSDNDSVRLKAIEMVLRTHGVMKESNTPNVPVVNIIINDPKTETSINPILIPRS